MEKNSESMDQDKVFIKRVIDGLASSSNIDDYLLEKFKRGQMETLRDALRGYGEECVKEMFSRAEMVCKSMMENRSYMKLLFKAFEMESCGDLQLKQDFYVKALDVINDLSDGATRFCEREFVIFTDKDNLPYTYDLNEWCVNDFFVSGNVNCHHLYISFKVEISKVKALIKKQVMAEQRRERFDELMMIGQSMDKPEEHDGQTSTRSSVDERLEKALRLSVEKGLAVKNGGKYEWIDKSRNVGLAYFMQEVVCQGEKGAFPEKKLGELFGKKRLTQSLYQLQDTKNPKWKERLDELISTIE